MKKIFALILALAMSVMCVSALAAGTNVYILTPTEDHGWTGSVATFAKMSADEINAGSSGYTANVQTADSPATQIIQIEDIIANHTADAAGVVILPQDDTVESALQQLIDAGIPYVAFDRIIEGVKDKAVSNVTGDNYGVGVAIAAYFVKCGMKPGDKVVVFEGDTSSVTGLRNSGFTDYITGAAEYEGAAIAEELKWADTSSVTFSGAMMWSRSNAKEYFESLMSDPTNADVKWFYSEDDEFALGIMEALEGSAIDDDTKAKILANKIFISAAGGSEELYSVIRGENKQDVAANFGGLAVGTYSPAMIQDAVAQMMAHLTGGEVTHDFVVPVSIVTAENVAEFVGFN